MKRTFVNTQPGRPHTMRALLNTNIPKLKGTTMKESTIEVKDLVVLNAKNEAITTSLKVAEVFGKRHDNVLQAIDNLIAQDKSLALNFQDMENIEKNALGRSFKIKHHEMDRDGFTYLALGFTGAKALKFKKEYVAAFNKMEEALKNRQVAPELASVETVRYLLGEYDKKDAEVKRLEAQTKKMAPKAKFYDAVSNARGNVNLQTAAKMLGRGPNKMTALLRDMGILFYTRNGIHVPAQRHINAGHFVVKTAVDHPGGDTPPRTPLQGQTTWPTTISFAHAIFRENPGCVSDRHSIRSRLTQWTIVSSPTEHSVFP